MADIRFPCPYFTLFYLMLQWADTVWPPGRAKDLLQTFAVSMEALKDDFEASKNEPVVQYDDVVSFCGNVTTLYEALSCERNRLDAYYHEKRARQDRRDVLAAEERKFACDERRHRETISYACFRILFGWNTWLYPKN